jgi:hypothetical protein
MPPTVMTPSPQQGSARIYQFPTGGRAALNGRRLSDVPAARQAATETVMSSGSWYHEAAVQDAKPAWDR